MEDIKERVKEYLQKNEVSQSAFAKMAGMAESTFSRWYGGSYPGDAKNIISKVTNFLDKEEARSRVKEIKDVTFAETTVSMNILNVLDYAAIQKQLVCIYGDAGVGKTFTTQYWMSGKTNVIFLTGSPAFNSPKAFLKLLSRKLKCRISGNKDDLFFDIVDKLEGTDTMLIIDEAQHFNVNTIEMIRSVKEAANIGLALIGNATIYDRLVGKQQAEFAQLFSRISMRTHILTDFFKITDVEKVFGKLDESVERYLLKICQSKYGLRGAVYLYTNCINNEDTTEKGLNSMARQMGILV